MASVTKRAPREPTAEARRLERKELRHELRRQAILDAARSLLVERGIEHFTIAAVASVAGVSKSAVYYYFDSKEQLVGGLAIAALRTETELLRGAVANAASGTEALAAMVRAYVDHYRKDLDAFRVLYVWPQVIGVEQRVLATEADSLTRSINEALAERLKADREAGRLDANLDPKTLANAARATAHGVISLAGAARQVGDPSGASVEELRDEACRLLVRSAAG